MFRISDIGYFPPFRNFREFPAISWAYFGLGLWAQLLFVFHWKPISCAILSYPFLRNNQIIQTNSIAAASNPSQRPGVVLRLPTPNRQFSHRFYGRRKTTPRFEFGARNSILGTFNQGMERRRWLIAAILICLVTFSSCRELNGSIKQKHEHQQHLATYNHTLATILVQYASAVYMSDLIELFTWTCSRCNGLTEGFEMIELIVDVKRCLQGFVGFSANLNAVVIAFRGTQESSIQNWVEDLFWKQLDCDYPGVDGAMVHHGFYNAYNNSSLRPGVLSAVQKAKELYGDTNIMVTGHSMGGAMAALCGLDLRLTLGEQQKVQVMTFGQPRIGNAVFASYYDTVVPDTIRVTNANDIVPHLPPYYHYFPQKTYHHFPREVWLHTISFGSFVYSVETICDGSGEDPTCSRSVSGNSIADHLNYYGVEMGCDESRKCKIVMNDRLAPYGRTDIDGNLIFLRDPSTSVVKQNIDGVDQVTAV